jgi:hypothetical protein
MLASMAQADKQDDSDGLTPAERLAQLQPPRPIDITIQPETAVVVITGVWGCSCRAGSIHMCAALRATVNLEMHTVPSDCCFAALPK